VRERALLLGAVWMQCSVELQNTVTDRYGGGICYVDIHVGITGYVVEREVREGLVWSH
jgi:hypothetical protein